MGRLAGLYRDVSGGPGEAASWEARDENEAAGRPGRVSGAGGWGGLATQGQGQARVRTQTATTNGEAGAWLPAQLYYVSFKQVLVPSTVSRWISKPSMLLFASDDKNHAGGLL